MAAASNLEPTLLPGSLGKRREPGNEVDLERLFSHEDAFAWKETIADLTCLTYVLINYVPRKKIAFASLRALFKTILVLSAFWALISSFVDRVLIAVLSVCKGTLVGPCGNFNTCRDTYKKYNTSARFGICRLLDEWSLCHELAQSFSIVCVVCNPFQSSSILNIFVLLEFWELLRNGANIAGCYFCLGVNFWVYKGALLRRRAINRIMTGWLENPVKVSFVTIVTIS